MCGIMGYYAFGKTIPDKKKIENMFVLLETRGRDASGFAFIDQKTNKLKVTKAAKPASDLVRSKSWKSLVLTNKMIFHTRMKTQGEPSNNMNNHPLFTKQGLAIVHNGMIYNDKEIFGRKQKRDAEVDSEAILALLSAKTKGKDRIKNIFNRLEGAFAVASIDQSDPERLLLIKKDNPIELYYNSKDDILYFCSEREIMQKALQITSFRKRGFGLGENDYFYFDMENNHALIINSDGVESYKKYYPKNFIWWDYQEIDDSDIIECPFCSGTTSYHWESLTNRCEHCGQIISEEDLYV